MTLSRKDFFRQGFFSLGDTLLKTAGIASPEAPPEQEFPTTDDVGNTAEPRCAEADNSRCLARSCGCFSCIERCEVQAITLAVGTGVLIDTALCTGCGACREVCPVTPKAIRLVRRAEHNQPAAA
ncbi:ATP-binding protein [Trichlorobacter ammonificans]|uniref:4Fe-4S ferredoxin n=1 Tax=Trichlorobacter ammonificans TaxID=2916410 RepID=A0ABM9D9G1_9BACT|nr:4Fe-4S binding protein [Trichlorobacter ammonificans]CAH2031864.1 putative 4Fe-4S ferredoxin [Trichlorobacter ammonificans]